MQTGAKEGEGTAEARRHRGGEGSWRGEKKEEEEEGREKRSKYVCGISIDQLIMKVRPGCLPIRAV